MAYPPDAPRSPRSRGRRTIPTIRNRTRGPAGVPGSPPLVAIATCAVVYDAASRWPPKPRCSSAARPSPIVISSTAERIRGAARRRSGPGPRRCRTSCRPRRRRPSSGAPTGTRANACKTAVAATPCTRPKACSCADVGSPVNKNTSAERLATLNRPNAESVRRAPATVATTTAPTTPTNNVSTTTVRQRRRMSHPANMPIAPTSPAPHKGRQTHQWGHPPHRGSTTSMVTTPFDANRRLTTRWPGPPKSWW